MKKIVMAGCLMFLSAGVAQAAVDSNATDSNSTVCTITSTMEYQPISDDTGKQVLTAKKTFQHCVETYSKRGPCVEWRETSGEMNIPSAVGIAVEELNTSGDRGSALAKIAAINQSNAIFSGVKGYCEIGMTQDTSWLEDPMFWASIAMSAISAAGDTSSAVGSASSATSKAKDLEKLTDLQKLAKVLNKGYSGCMVSAGMGMMDAALKYAKDDSEDCDPVDEFCGDDTGEINLDPDPTLIKTITTDEYNTILSEHPESADSFEVLKNDTSTGFVTIRLKTASEIVNTNDIQNSDEAKAAQDEAKKKALEMKAIMVGVQLAGCAGKHYFDVNVRDTTSNPTGGGDASSSANNPIVSTAVNLLPFPYNTIGSVALKLVDTWHDVDSCHDEDDANAQGQRHVKAYRGIRFNTCHPVSVKVVERWPATHDTMRKGYTYCCYDSPMSKILMVQIKSQIGKGWTHCTDVTPNELSHVSFTQCTPEQMNPAANGGYKDGASFRGEEGVDYDMRNSYQYHFQCMNLSELENYIESQVPIDFSQTQVSEILKDITPDMTQ